MLALLIRFSVRSHGFVLAAAGLLFVVGSLVLMRTPVDVLSCDVYVNVTGTDDELPFKFPKAVSSSSSSGSEGGSPAVVAASSSIVPDRVDWVEIG